MSMPAISTARPDVTPGALGAVPRLGTAGAASRVHGEPVVVGQSGGVGDDLPRRLVGGTALALAVVLSTTVPALVSAGGPWLPFMLAALMVIWGAAPFHREFWAGLRDGSANLATLVSCGTVGALGWSLLMLVMAGGRGSPQAPGGVPQPSILSTLAAGGPATYLLIATGITWLAVAGRYAERRSVTAPPVPSGPVTEVRTSAGSGEVAYGLQERTITDWTSRAIALLAVVTAGGAVGFWLAASGNSPSAGAAAVAVLVVACSGGLLWATPLVTTLGARRGAQLGLRLADLRALAGAEGVDTVVISSAASLTTDDPRVVDVATVDGTSVLDVLEKVGTLGATSPQSAIRAIVATAHASQVRLGRAEVVAEGPGLGVQGVVDGRTVAVGGDSLLASSRAGDAPSGGLGPLPRHLARTKASAEAAGRTTLLAAWDGEVRGLIVLAEPVRSEACEAVAQMRASGLRPLLLTTGDEQDRAIAIARRVGIDDVVVAPSAEEAGAAQRRVGPGPTDQQAPRVLATIDGEAADLSAPQGAVIDIVSRPAAHRASGLARRAPGNAQQAFDLWSAVDALRYCQAMGRIVRQNRFLAFGLTVPAIGLAASGYVSPARAAVVIAGSVLPVALNSWRITRFRPLRPPAHRFTGQ